jgi:hypothetical protein
MKYKNGVARKARISMTSWGLIWKRYHFGLEGARVLRYQLEKACDARHPVIVRVPRKIREARADESGLMGDKEYIEVIITRVDEPEVANQESRVVVFDAFGNRIVLNARNVMKLKGAEGQDIRKKPARRQRMRRQRFPQLELFE